MKNILIVEDEVLIQHIMASELAHALPSSENVTHTFCNNLKEALHLVGAEQYDLISVDGRFREAEPGSSFTSTAGPRLIHRLSEINFPGHVVFYSANDEQVARMGQIFVSGRRVISLVKPIGSLGESWAKLVMELLFSS